MGEPELGLVGWGSQTCSLTHFAFSTGTTLLVRVLHLSRFAIYGRPESRHATDHLSSFIARHL